MTGELSYGIGKGYGLKTRHTLMMFSWVAGAALIAPLSMASTVSMTFNEDLSGTTAGSATLSITDIGANEVQVTLTPDFAGTSAQTITGLWLNDPGLTSVTVTPVSPNPNAYVSSAYTSTQTTVPAGTTSNVTGQYDTYIKFNNGSGAVIQGTSPAEVFDISGTGATLDAASFNLTDAPKGAGSPSNIYGLIGLTNYLGTAGSGVGYIAAVSDTVSTVPLPAAFPLLFAGLGGLGVLARRRK
jgi:hypothetical protein